MKQRYSSKPLKEGEYYLADILTAVMEADTFGPVRIIKARKGGPHKITFPSWKARLNSRSYKTLFIEGENEMNAAYLLEVDPEVHFFKAQPFMLVFHNGKKITRYTPDFLVWRKNQPPVIIEAKVDAASVSKKTQAVLNTVKAASEGAGVSFKLMLSSENNKEPRATNLERLYTQTGYPDRRTPEAKAIRDAFLHSLESHGGKAMLGTLYNDSPLVTEKGLAYALFDGSVTSTHRFPVGKYFEVELAESL